ncbi:hypothetical protein PTKU46_90900 [Paraburkholderia terrae]
MMPGKVGTARSDIETAGFDECERTDQILQMRERIKPNIEQRMQPVSCDNSMSFASS